MTTSTFSKVFVGLSNINIATPYTLLKVVMKYLIKLWKYDNNEFINSLEWESDKKVEPFIIEVSKSLPNGTRATIEEKDVKRENKTTR